ncbi:hypothetical protein [Salibaculum sp.]|uniref:hypothetical protein n=1 Tax=Salibaculum sp. TaxID=2855480 RepID=UPI002B49C37A|nr:hypothetical protein [Salibaculum sp.]HKL70973.1 hypothetical protein [Salibaculum sp.]
MVATRGLTIDEVKGDTGWSALERDLLDACATGRFAVTMNENPPALSDPPTVAEMVDRFRPKGTQDPGRRVRPALIRYLLEGGCADGARPHPKGVKLAGAWIDGELDLQGCRTELDLSLHHCLFPARPTFRDAHLGALHLSGSRMEKGLDLQRLRIETGLHLRDGFSAKGGVDLSGAWIKGHLDCKGGLFSTDRGPALTVNSATIGGTLFMIDAFQAYGEVNLCQVNIAGHLDCSGGRFYGDLGRALYANGASVGASVFLSSGFYARGEVNLVAAKITVQLACVGGRFDGVGGRALDADAAVIGAHVLLRGGFHATGEVNLTGANITGQLSCDGGRFDGAGGRALTAQAAVIGADVFLREGVHATGVMDFVRARITGNLSIAGATLADGLALESARITEGLFWRDLRDTCRGIDLTEASCGVLHDERGAWDRTKEMHLSGFTYDRLQSDMSLGERLHWLGRKTERALPPEFAANLRAQPWLGEDRSAFDPQPYTHLARVLDAQGNRGGAARVLERREHLVRVAAQRRALSRVDGTWQAALASLPAVGTRGVDALFRGVFGYGHAPARALLWVLAILLGASVLYGTAYRAGQMAPNSDVVLTSPAWQAAVAAGCAPVDWAAVGWSAPQDTADCTMPLHAWLAEAPAAADYESFNAGLYALDLFVPLDALGQETTWAPSRDRGWWGWLGYALRMPIQMAGWLITAVGAAVLTGLVGRRD